jgi:integrase
MSNLTISFKWNRRKKTVPKSKNLPIECVLRHAQKEKVFHLEAYKIKGENWDTRRQAVKKHRGAIAINEKLLSFVSLTKDYQAECFEKNLIVNLDTLKDYILNGRGAKDDFICFIEDTIKKEQKRYENAKKSGIKRKGVKSKATIYTYRTMLGWLKKYRETISYAEIDIALVEGFADFLSVSYSRNWKTKKVLLSAISISATIKTLKVFINLADRYEKLVRANPSRFVTVGTEIGKKNPISYEQVMQIYDFDCATIKGAKGDFISKAKADRLTTRKEMFIFQCLTGLSTVDFFRMTRANLHEKNGTTWLISTRQKVEWKSSKVFRVPISSIFEGIPLAIWKKHARLKIGDSTPIFNKVDAKEYNKSVRFVVQYCGINQYVRIKDARDTFAALCRMSGIRSERIISNMMGHASTKQTDEYGGDNFFEEWEMIEKAK